MSLTRKIFGAWSVFAIVFCLVGGDYWAALACFNAAMVICTPILD